MSDAPLGWCQNGWVKREMNRRDEAERAEGGGGDFLYRPGWARSTAGGKSGTKLYLHSDDPLCPSLPSRFSLYRPHIISTRFTVLSKDHPGAKVDNVFL